MHSCPAFEIETLMIDGQLNKRLKHFNSLELLVIDVVECDCGIQKHSSMQAAECTDTAHPLSTPWSAPLAAVGMFPAPSAAAVEAQQIAEAQRLSLAEALHSTPAGGAGRNGTYVGEGSGCAGGNGGGRRLKADPDGWVHILGSGAARVDGPQLQQQQQQQQQSNLTSPALSTTPISTRTPSSGSGLSSPREEQNGSAAPARSGVRSMWLCDGAQRALFNKPSSSKSCCLEGLSITRQSMDGVLLVALLISIGLFLCFLLLVNGMHGASALGILFSFTNVGVVLTAYAVIYLSNWRGFPPV
eukprot:1160320-Pelagomonas_calceolata.AAC.4